jgi:hypothetical protein
MKRFLPLLALAGWLLAPWLGRAVSTAYFEVDAFDQFNRGEPVEAVISSRGEVRPGAALERTPVGVEGIWDVLVSSSGTLFLGTGNKGQLWRMEKGKPVLDYETKKLMITALAEDRQGNLYFAAIPKAVIFRRTPNGQVTEWAKPGAEYVWTLLYDPGRGLLAGTGPDGKVLVIGSDGKVKTLVETGAEHVLSLARDPEGIVYGTTSGKGFLFSITPKSKFRIEESFEEGEVKRVVPIQDGSGEWLAVGVNQTRGRGGPSGLPSLLKKMPSPPSDKGGGPEEGEIRGNGDGEGKEKEEGAGIPALKDIMAARGPGKISGTVYAVRLGKGKRVLLPLSGAAVTDLVADDSGAVFAATDQEGKVYRIEPAEAVYAVEFDLKAEQTLALALEGGKLRWIGSGMPGGLARVTDRLSAKAEYYSEVFDASFPARWGKFTERGEGKTKIETRSGNTEEPDGGWSEWQALSEKNELVASPPARYLQVRASWPGQSQAALQVFNLAYAVANQPHYVAQVDVGSAPERPSEKPLLSRPSLMDQDKGKEPSPPDRERSSRSPSGPSIRIQIRWKMDNPDGDPLLFKLSYQPEGFKKWIPIQTDKDITRPRFEWDTESIPDGYYRIKVWASDEQANPPDQVTVAEKESKPFLVDNTRPEVIGLKLGAKNLISGTAKDRTSPITRIEYSLDGRDWVPVAPADGIFDELEENFEFALPAGTPSGPHTLAVRAYDKAENPGVNQITFTLP